MQFLIEEEKQKILNESHLAESDYSADITIHELFEQQATRSPTDIALLYNDQLLTYDELNIKANQLAHYLRKLKTKPDSLIGLCMDPSLELMVTLLAILKAGGAYVPFDPSYPAERLQFMIEDANLTLLLTDSKQGGIFKNAKVNLVCLDENKELIANEDISNPVNINEPENLAYVIYTSGSTGKPKGVMITHRNVVNFIHWFSNALCISNHDIVDFSSSISFDFSVATTLFPICAGAKVVICPQTRRTDPYLYIQHLLKSQASIIKITPSRFRQIREFINPDHAFDSLKWLVFGGETIFAKDVADWLKQFPNHKILNEYGPTETTVATSWLVVDKTNINQFEKYIPIGKPALNSELYILNENLDPVPFGTIGELYIGGMGVAKGYLNRAELTANRFITNPFSHHPYAKMYKTGDLCHYLDDGNIEFSGRIDQQIKIRGFRVETAEIETGLVLHECIQAAAVIARENQSGEKQLIAYYVINNTGPVPSTRELRAFLQKYLPEYMIPTAFVAMKTLPINPNGKLDREALPDPSPQANEPYVAPRTELEKIIQEIWIQVFNFAHISVYDNFFELGGHSLAAARIISKMRKKLKKEIKLQAFYNAPTIRELAQIINQAEDIDKTHFHYPVLQKAPKMVPLSEMQLLLWLAQKFHSKSKALNIIDSRRLSGQINLAALNFAFECAFKKHPILYYQVSNFFPANYLQKNIRFKVAERDIKHLSEEEKEKELCTSLRLMKKHMWKKRMPLIKAILFHIDEKTVELQICLSHLISDEISTKILFSDLSNFYISYLNKLNLDIKTENVSYLHYALLECDNFNSKTEKAIAFWREYLKDANSILFPISAILKNEKTEDTPCTTYIKLPEKSLKILESFCKQHYLTITDSLCAAVSLALVPYIDSNQSEGGKTLAINLVRSTRDNEVYDNAIGCFIRNDLIKIHINHSNSENFVELAKEVHNSISKTAPYQTCATIIKIACLFKDYWKNKKISSFLINQCARFLSKTFRSFKLNHEVLNMYGRMFLAGSDRFFLAEINIMNNFLSHYKSENSHQFGMKLKDRKHCQFERIVATNILDICFERDMQNNAYLIISGNVHSALREEIGNTIFRKLNEIYS